MKPLCFVLMPFGVKPDETGRPIDFDAVYRTIIEPAVADAGLEAIRADEEVLGGSIHKPMFERLMLCEYAVADLTTGNPNVLYELGIRHAVRPRSTTVIFRDGTRLPFDLAPLRGLPYRMDAPQEAAETLAERLREAKQAHDDSPVYEMLDGLPRPEIAHIKTDVFRDRVNYSAKLKERLLQSRRRGKEGIADIHAVRAELGDLIDAEAGVLVDMFLSMRAVGAYQDMIDLYGEMPRPFQEARLVREQYGFALTRENRREEAIDVYGGIIAKYGPNPETNGLLGRVYKDQWDEENKAGKAVQAIGSLKKAVNAYLAGFEADWRDAYPGVNAVTLMEMMTPVDPRQADILPVVRYAASRRVATHGGDYWDHATLAELAVLARDQEAAALHLSDALAVVKQRREIFAPDTTARNLGLIRLKRSQRGEDCCWIEEIENSLREVAQEMRDGR